MFSKKSDKPTTRLRELSGSDYQIAKGQPDIRGWDVRDASGRKFGVVSDLIFDIRANKVRYIVLNVLDTRELELEKRTVLVPIGLAELDDSDNDVMLPSVTPFQLRALPRYDKSNLGAKAERDISTVFGRSGIAGTSTGTQPQTTAGQEEDVDESFYNHDHFNEDNMYKRRRGNAANPRTDARHSDEEAYLRREAELGRPISSANRDDPYHPGYNPDGTERIETDEEYYRRTGRNRRM